MEKGTDYTVQVRIEGADEAKLALAEILELANRTQAALSEAEAALNRLAGQTAEHPPEQKMTEVANATDERADRPVKDAHKTDCPYCAERRSRGHNFCGRCGKRLNP